MTQSNLNQAGLKATAFALYKLSIRNVPREECDVFYFEEWKEQAKAAIAAYLECVDGWQPIDSADKSKGNRPIWVSDGEHALPVFWHHTHWTFLYARGEDTFRPIVFTPTHWQPLPACPKVEGGI